MPISPTPVRGWALLCVVALGAGLLADSAAAQRPLGGGLRHKPLTAKFLPGESHVPGFPQTPDPPGDAYIDAFMRAEADDPHEARMLHAFQHPDMGLALAAFLPRYRSPGLVEPTRKLVRATRNPAVQAGAIGGLIGMWDDTAETRALVRGLLRAPQPTVRGRAAEYLEWLGAPDDFRFLTTAAGLEKDLHARAAMTRAAAAIRRRAEVFGPGTAAATDAEDDPAACYEALATALRDHPTAATRAAVINRLRRVERCEPVTRYPDRTEQGRRGAALLAVHRLLAGYPAAAEPMEEAGACPVARTLVPPVRDYFDPRRKSYGILIKEENHGAVFAGLHHVGDDCAWRQDHETVVAIGHGIVRRVELGQRSWGGLVVVEHRDAKGGNFCSLYGHLGPLICVRPGQAVTPGQKLGSVGVSYSHGGGGFLAHLHFGIHRSAYLTPDLVGDMIPTEDDSGAAVRAEVRAVHERHVDAVLPDGSTKSIPRKAAWTRGYLSPEKFAAGTNRWTDPQELIRKSL